MEYPKYKREEKSSAKLSEKDILKCKKLRLQGFCIKDIVKKFKISYYAIWVILLSDEKKKEYFKNQYLKRGKRKVSHEVRKKYYERKKIKHGKTYTRWTRDNSKQYEKNNKEKVYKRKTLYRKRNLEKFRGYSKKHYAKRKGLSVYVSQLA
jgi:hypothetical protein